MKALEMARTSEPGRWTLLAALAITWGFSGCECSGYSAHDADGGVGPCRDGECNCDEDPLAPGCPCDEVEPVTCYPGPVGTAGIGTCRVGFRECRDGAWQPCFGAVLPTEEICDELDNDCDGEVDDGVLSACGDCSETCVELRYGHEEGDIPFDPEESNSSGVDTNDEGALVLEGDTYDLHAIWIPHSREGLVSKVSTQTREVIATYQTGPVGPEDDPSRTSLDYRGNAFVANRALYNGGDGQASITKIYERNCPDLDRDGRIDTSGGVDDVLFWGDDECVAWNTPIGALRAGGRAVVVQTRVTEDETADYVWAGLYTEQRYVELDAETGELTGREVGVSPCMPYGAAIDRDGNLWSSCMSQSLARFDTEDPEDVEVLRPPSATYGITVDQDGMVWSAWMGGGCFRYDPFEERFTPIGGCGGYGIATDGESVWVGNGQTLRIDMDTLVAHSIPVDSNRGVGVDFDGFVWALPLSGRISVIDPDDEAIEPVLRDCDGGLCIPYTYIYSDMTGLQLRTATNTSGSWEAVFEGCGGDVLTRWVSLDWEAETPAETTIVFQVRTGDTIDDLREAPWIDAAVAPGVRPPMELADVLGDAAYAPLLAVNVVLQTGLRGSSPVLHSLAVQRTCPDGFR